LSFPAFPIFIGKINEMKDSDFSIPDCLVIFDCDGVLIDSEAVSSRIEHDALRRQGCLISREEYLELSLGRSDEDELWRSLALSWDIELPKGFSDMIRAEINEALRSELQPIDGVMEMLEQLSCEKCIASGASPERLELTLGLTGLSGEFTGRCFSGHMVSRGKPFPDVFLLAARSMGYSPRNCIVVEDSTNGVKAAISAGMTVFGFTGASHCLPSLGDELRALGCREVFFDLRDLPALLREFSRA